MQNKLVNPPSSNINQKPFVIAVEGILGAGKSTLINKVLAPRLRAQGYKVSIVAEPVEKWKEILVLFGNDRKRWSYHFQTKANHDRIQECISVWEAGGMHADIIITDRSVISDTFFMDLLHEAGDVTDMEYDHYKEWWKLWNRIVPFQPDLFIYLDTPIDKCMNQLRKRNRDGESSITKEYQLVLQKKHADFFRESKVNIGSKIVPVYSLSTNKDLFELSDNYIDIIIQYGSDKLPLRIC